MKEFDTVALESQEHRDLLDIVDKLRSAGVSHYIDLPQIVVCGDQSSGKSSVLHDQVPSQFPKVVAYLEENIRGCGEQLQKIGPSRSTIGEQSRYLLKASHQFYQLMKDASDGNYTDPFFCTTDEGPQKRLRAIIQNSLLQIAGTMEKTGRTKTIVDGKARIPSEMSREDFLKHVEQLIATNRGRELPGTYNPAIVGQLFRDQSKKWREILEKEAELILRRVRDAVGAVLKHIIDDDDVADGVFRWILNTALSDIGQALTQKLDEILTPHESLHPITYNPSLSDLVRQRRLARQEAEFKAIARDLKRDWLNKDPLGERLVSLLVEKAKRDLDREASSDAVDWMEAYYDVSLKRVMDDFSVLAVECCVVQKLPALFSPEIVYSLDDEVVGRIAGESEATAAERARLTDMLHTLEGGLRDLRQRTGYQSGVHGLRLPVNVQLSTASAPAQMGSPTHQLVNLTANGVTPTVALDLTPGSPVKVQPPSPPQEVEEPVVDEDFLPTPKKTTKKKKTSMWDTMEAEPEPPESEPEIAESAQEYAPVYFSKMDKKQEETSIWDEPEPEPEPIPEPAQEADPLYVSKKDKKKKKKKEPLREPESAPSTSGVEVGNV